MRIDIIIPITCKYCDRPVELDCPGYGFYLNDKLEAVYFHSECLNEFEGVLIT